MQNNGTRVGARVSYENIACPARDKWTSHQQSGSCQTDFPETDEPLTIGRDCTLRLREYDIFFSSPEPAGLYRGCSGAARPFLVRQ
jgi:hypothetical protein